MKGSPVENIRRKSPHHPHSNRIYLSPSLHHVRYRQNFFALENHSICASKSSSSPRPDRNSQRKFSNTNHYSSSCSSLNSYLRDHHLSLNDYLELREALRTLLTSSNTTENRKDLCDLHHQRRRLMSPYLQSRSNNHDQSSLPLYTDEHFIRNGLLNHNEGPDVRDQTSTTVRSSSLLHLHSGRQHLFTAMTSNFTNDNSQCLPSTNASSFIGDVGKNPQGDETNSMWIRREKVKAWERENLFLRSESIECPMIKQPERLETTEFHLDLTHQHRLQLSHDPAVHTSHQSVLEGKTETEGVCHEERKLISCSNGTTDPIFPMVKVLGKTTRTKHDLSIEC